MSDEVEGVFIGHCECPLHGGSDSLALYDKGDYIDGFCWAKCGYVSKKVLIENEILDEKGEQILVDLVSSSSGSGEFIMTEEVMAKVNEVLDKPITGWRERQIPKIVDEFYGTRTHKVDGEVKYRYYQSTIDGSLVGWHVRNDFAKKAKNRGEKPDTQPFFPIGKVRSDCELFGQSLFQKGGKYLVIASGEEDAMAIFASLNLDRSSGKAVLNKFITPVISTTVGEAAQKQIKSNYEWITSFDRVVIMYDNDDAGRSGAEVVARMLKPGQACIAKYRRNDACDHTKRGEFSEVVSAFWNAAKGEPYSPAGIVGSSQTFEALMQRAMFEKIPLPAFAEDLEIMFNGGPALGEITTIAAASSVGKTTIVNEFLYKWIFDAPYKVGVISLESDLGELTENLIGLHLGVKLANLDDTEKLEMYNTPKFKEKYNTLVCNETGEDRFYILDHQGAVTDGSLFNKIEYMVKVLGCKIIVLDPMTLALSGEGNEGMDKFMSDLLRFVKREKISHINVVHVRKSQSGAKANSRGAEISEEDIKGCLDAETEYLSPTGWKRMDEYDGGKVAQYTSDGEIEFVLPNEYMSIPTDNEFIRFYNKTRIDMVVSENHRMVLDGEFRLAKDVANKVGRSVVPTTFKQKNGKSEDWDDTFTDFKIPLMVACAADACYHGNGLAKAEFSKERKIESFGLLLDECGVTYTKTVNGRGNTTFRFKALTSDKDLDKCYDWYTAPLRDLESLINCVFQWDGTVDHETGECVYYTSKKSEADVVQFAAVATGRVSQIREYNGHYHVSIAGECSNKNKVYLRGDNIEIERIKGNGYMYCFSVPTECFVVRRNNKVFVTGNSGSVFQVSMNNILLMRDKVNENPKIRNTTKVVVSKNRRCGKTGPAGFWFYEEKSGRLVKGVDPATLEDADLAFDDELMEFSALGAVDKNTDSSVIEAFNAKETTSEDVPWDVVENN